MGAATVGAIARGRLPGLPRLVAAGLLGLIPIYCLGAAWLALQLQSPSYEVVVVGGVLQFLPLDALKALIAAFAARSLFSLPLGLPALPRGR
jgi:biotin transporter BioY